MLSYETLRGGEAMPLAGAIWDALPEKIRRFCLFDVPHQKRRLHLSTCWLNASHVCIAWSAEKLPVAVGWLMPTAPAYGTAFCHFILTKNPRQQEITQHFCDLSLAYYDCLLCLVPQPYRSLRQILAQCGFRQIALLPKGCFLANHTRAVNGCLLMLEKTHV